MHWNCTRCTIQSRTIHSLLQRKWGACIFRWTDSNRQQNQSVTLLIEVKGLFQVTSVRNDPVSVTENDFILHGPRQANLVLIAYAAAKVQASLRIRAVSPEPPLLAHTSSESSGTFRQKARSLAPLNGWACAVKICHNGMLEDTNSLDGAHIV